MILRRPDVAHPLIAPAPRLAGPLAGLARRVVLGGLARGHHAGRLDLRLPDGDRVALGAAARPDATITIHDERAFTRAALRGELGAGEAYVAGDWDADDLPRALRVFLRATEARGVESALTRVAALPAWWRHRRARNDRAGSARNVMAHYDLGNAFYRLFLDEQMVYSCARWSGATTLEAAQRAKLAHLCDLAAVAPGDRVLEIGCGWGALALEAAGRGAHVTGVTVSPSQLAFAQARVAAAGAVGERVALSCRDYRDVGGEYDAILSCEMLEAVGQRYLPDYFAQVARRLRPGGRAVIQSITMPDDRYAAYCRSVDWMQTYVFPGSHIPSMGAIRAAAGAAGLVVDHAEDIGPDYAPTLQAWRTRFATALPAVRALGFDEPFVRTWNLYLAFSEAAFAERTLGVHQLVLRRA
jgi:cyclopropane-fatty-acyl-phospholipid synthase